MNLFDRVARRFGYMKTQRATQPSPWLQAEGAAAQWAIPDGAMWEHQSELYRRLSWVQIAVSTVAQVAATTPFNVYQINGEEQDDMPNHPFEMLLNHPNPLDSRFELLFSTFAFEALTGNAYWWLNKSNEAAQPSEIWVMEPHKVQPVPDGNQYLRGYVYRPAMGIEIALEPWEVVHFRRFHPLDRFVGLSPIEALATVAEGDMGMQRWNSNYFSKEYAKPAGALAYSDPVEPTEWKRMQAETQRQFGGTKRNLLMLQNVGKGGVSWIPMNTTHRDMEFLQGRTFTREEIFAIYAPGLASILAVNATEANSQAGKGTFLEFAVWPQLVKAAEKISNDVLPIYGDKLTGEFEDIRITDRAMQLAEQNAFAQVHTIDEIRQKHYGSQPLGDERGALLPAEVTKGAPPAPTAPGTNGDAAQPAQDAPSDAIQADSTENNGELAKAEEAKALKAWLKKRKNADLSKFKASHLSIEEMRKIAGLPEEAATEQDFFTWTGKAIRRNALEDGADRERAAMERAHGAAIEAAFARLLKKIVPPGTTVESITPDSAMERYRANESILRDAIIEMLTDAALFGAEFGMHQVDRAMGAKAVIISGANWDLVNERVLQWVMGSGGTFGQGYGGSVLLQQLFQTSERTLRTAIGEWISNGLPLRQLVRTLEQTVFSSQRAEMIAVTEVTRAFAEGNRAAWQESGIITRMRWETAADELVCPTCAPLQGQLAEVTATFDGGLFPPAHPRCRCWITPVVVGVND